MKMSVKTDIGLQKLSTIIDTPYEQLYNYKSWKGLTKIYDSDMCCHLNIDPERVSLTILSKRELT